jgi:hypothetical protein
MLAPASMSTFMTSALPLRHVLVSGDSLYCCGGGTHVPARRESLDVFHTRAHTSTADPGNTRRTHFQALGVGAGLERCARRLDVISKRRLHQRIVRGALCGTGRRHIRRVPFLAAVTHRRRRAQPAWRGLRRRLGERERRRASARRRRSEQCDSSARARRRNAHQARWHWAGLRSARVRAGADGKVSTDKNCALAGGAAVRCAHAHALPRRARVMHSRADRAGRGAAPAAGHAACANTSGTARTQHATKNPSAPHAPPRRPLRAWARTRGAAEHAAR